MMNAAVANSDGGAGSKCSGNLQPVVLLGHYCDCPLKARWSKAVNFRSSQGDWTRWHRPVCAFLYAALALAGGLF
jgi:hypothetical protein